MRPKYTYQWTPIRIDKKALAADCTSLTNIAHKYRNTDPNFRLVSYYASSIWQCVEKSSVLLLYDYRELCTVVDKLADSPVYEEMIMIVGDLYVILDLGTLEQDTANKLAIEKQWMIKKGYVDA